MAFSISRTLNFYIKKLSADIDSAIVGLASNDNATKKIFSTMTPNGNCCLGNSSTDPVNPVYIRSTTCWAKNIDTSPISPWNNGGGYSVPESAGGGGGTGTLISPRHILLANHFYIKSGKKLIFVDMSNNCYIRTLSNSLQVGTTDLRIGLLDSDLPSNVSFCKVASLDLTQKITATNNIPLIYTDQNRAAFIANTNNDPSSFQYIVQSSDPQRTKFWYTLVGGDSGNPACFVYNNKLILLLHFMVANGGYCAPFYINEINSVMNTLGGGYNLSIFNIEDIDPIVNSISVKTKNTGGGKISLSKFNPTNISNIESWTSQGNLSVIFNYNIPYVSYTASYSGDIDTTYYADDNTYTSYTGEEFGFTIVYSDAQGVWFLIDPNIEADIAYAEDLLAGVWFTYGGLDYFELNDYEYSSNSPTDLKKSTWSDISGKNNDLITRFNPANRGIGQDTLNNLSRKQIGTPFRTNNWIDLGNPFTIYIALSDSYAGTNTRKIFGMDSFPNAGPTYYSQLYLESTSSGINHIFTLKFFNWNGSNGSTTTICSFTVNKSVFASDTVGPSILKLSSNYQTNSSSPIRNMTLTYYNRYSDVNKTLGSLSASGLVNLNITIPNQWLYLGNSNFGYDGISPYWLRLSEFIMYSKFLNSTEDGAINRYLQRKYYGKLLS
jgi:hypothetical protein